MLIPGGLVVTIAPNQEPEAYAAPVEGVILDLDDDLRVFMTMEQAVHLYDQLDDMLAQSIAGENDDPDDRDPTVNELLDRGEL